jgi:hypothetical protein
MFEHLNPRIFTPQQIDDISRETLVHRQMATMKLTAPLIAVKIVELNPTPAALQRLAGMDFPSLMAKPNVIYNVMRRFGTTQREQIETYANHMGNETEWDEEEMLDEADISREKLLEKHGYG